MTFACLASDKGEQGSVALVMTTGKHGLILKSAPIQPQPSMRLFTRYLCQRQSFVNSSAHNSTICSTGHPAGYRGYLCRLWSSDTLATYYYLIANIFFLGLVPSLLHQLHIFVLQCLNHLWLVKNVFVCAYSQNPCSHTAPTHASFILGNFCAQ